MGRRHVEDELAEALPALSPADRALCQEMVYGVVRWQAALDWLVKDRTQGRPQKHTVQVLLRLGLYQLLWMDRVPDHAAVFETVELARQAGFGPQSGFVNAVLRHYAREREATRGRLEALKASDPATGWSQPGWLVDRWRARWGEEAARGLLAWNNRASEVYARVNTLRADPGTVLEHWRLKENVVYDFVRAEWLEENLVFRLREHPTLTGMESFSRGWFYVQDPSTLLAVEMLAPAPGERILDMCAAPGGKTTYVAQRVANGARVVARDESPDRLRRVTENCRRLGVTCVEVEVAGRERVAATEGVFDRVLLDAPCSNTGVMQRRIGLRWRVRPTELARLAGEQLALMGQAARQVRPGGVVVYSTCSLEPEENGELVRRFLADHPGFKLEAERELWPFRDGMDGAYAARLRRAG